jgi:hypothetical protein
VTELVLVAIDWSGRADDRGQTTWMAVVEDGVFCRLENGRSRPELRDELIRLRGTSGRLVAGIDFAFGFPHWYAKANGWTSGRDIWRAASRDGESWLTSESAPFWGRTTKRPPHPGARLRRTEQESGGSPRSVFQIGGAGAVGTGSIRGMQILHELAEAGFTIWPFDPAGDAAIIEILPPPAHRDSGQVIGPGMPAAPQCALSKGRTARSLPRHGSGNRRCLRRRGISAGDGAGTRRTVPASRRRRHRPHRRTDLVASAVTPSIDRAA